MGLQPYVAPVAYDMRAATGVLRVGHNIQYRHILWITLLKAHSLVGGA